MKHLRALLILSVSMLAFTAHSNESVEYQHYFAMAKQRASGLIVIYYGAQNIIESFENGPAGTFKINTRNTATGETKELFMLSDMQHILEGTMYSQLSRDMSSANGIPALERIIQSNIDRDELVKKVARQTSQPIRGGTAASLLEGFSDYTADASNVQPLENIVEVPNTSKELYESFDGLHYASHGTGDEIVYIFVDHNCPACIQMHAALNDEDIPANVSVRYIPVGIVNKDSEAKATYVLSINDQEIRMDVSSRLLVSKPLNELVAAEADPAKIQQGWTRFRENTLAFFTLPVPATPFIAAKRADQYVLTAVADPTLLKEIISSVSQNGSQVNQ